MTEQPPRAESEENERLERRRRLRKESRVRTYYLTSWCFLIAALIFSAYGIYKVYDNSYDAKIVGGDAYNFIIYATRGTAWVCVGVVSAVIGLIFATFANLANDSK